MLFSSYLVSAATALLLLSPVSVVARPTNNLEVRDATSAAVNAALSPIQAAIGSFKSDLSSQQWTTALTNLNSVLSTAESQIAAIPAPASTKRNLAPRQTAASVGGLLSTIINDILADLSPVLVEIRTGLIPGLDDLLNEVLVALEDILTGVKLLLPSVIATVESLLGAVGALLAQL
ncbi:hypothetical protein FRB96_003201 [Tulasnella sp. 330]|nr:hypothetical protein FRB96_003201 [Tulasnella sp. 330]KAG8871739.1 hypothetical protein FRB97_008334 [Tulasnella sp. 331]KAG8877316.1 hypothetical protein FRB98_006766 [Tulasnella sp. 332]